jgi:outer membrane protein
MKSLLSAALASLALLMGQSAKAQFISTDSDTLTTVPEDSVQIASQTSLGTVWTLDECIRYALENNITLKQNVYTYLSGMEDTEEAKAALFPTLSFSTSQGVTNRPFTETQSTVVGSQVYSTKKNSYTGNYSLGANVTLYSGSSLRTAVKQSKLQNSIDSLSIETSKKDLIISIMEAYMQCLYAKEAISVAESTAASAKASLDRAKELKQAGELSKVDVAQLESQYASDAYQVVTAKNSLDNYKLQLKQLLELGINDEIDVVDPGASEDEVLALLPSKQDVFANAMEAMPEVRQAVLNVDAADLSIKQAKSGYYPTLSSSLSVGSTNVSDAGSSMTSQLRNNLNESIGLTLSVPIFEGRRTKTAVNKAKLSAESARLSQQSTEKEVLKEIEDTYLNAVSYQSQYVSAKQQAQYAQESYELTNESFKVGAMNTVELITAENTMTSAQQQVLQSKYMALLNISLLDIYQGKYESYGVEY